MIQEFAIVYGFLGVLALIEWLGETKEKARR